MSRRPPPHPPLQCQGDNLGQIVVQHQGENVRILLRLGIRVECRACRGARATTTTTTASNLHPRWPFPPDPSAPAGAHAPPPQPPPQPAANTLPSPAYDAARLQGRHNRDHLPSLRTASRRLFSGLEKQVRSKLEVSSKEAGTSCRRARDQRKGRRTNGAFIMRPPFSRAHGTRAARTPPSNEGKLAQHLRPGEMVEVSTPGVHVQAPLAGLLHHVG